MNICSTIQYNDIGGTNMNDVIVEQEIEINDYLEDIANLFKILGDFTRTKILACLEKGDANVSNISTIIGLPISAISHQLRILRQAKLIRPTKNGKEVYYSLDDEHVSQIFRCALEHVKE